MIVNYFFHISDPFQVPQNTEKWGLEGLECRIDDQKKHFFCHYFVVFCAYFAFSWLFFCFSVQPPAPAILRQGSNRLSPNACPQLRSGVVVGNPVIYVPIRHPSTVLGPSHLRTPPETTTALLCTKSPNSLCISASIWARRPCSRWYHTPCAILASKALSSRSFVPTNPERHR